MQLIVVHDYLVSTLSGGTSRKAIVFLIKGTTQVAWPFALYPSPFRPAWVTEATPGGRVTFLQNQLKAVVPRSGMGSRRGPGPWCLAWDAA